MAVNLKKVLSQKTYENLEEYIENGKDAISMLGYKNAENFSATNVVTKFQTLADPDFIQSIRQNWGDINGTMPFEIMEGVPAFIANTHNSFSLKSRFFNIGKLRFPLVGDYKNINKNYVSEKDNIQNFDAIKKLFESKFNIQITEKLKTSNIIEYKGGKIRYCGEAVSSILKTAQRFKNKVFSPKIQNSEKEYGLKLTPSRVGLGKAKLFLASHFKGQEVEKAEKVVALVNYWSGKTVFQIIKKHKNLFKNDIAKNPKQIAFTAQLLTNIFISQAIELGKDTNKKIDNALKLQLSNVIASSNLSPKEMKLSAKIAEVATYTLLEKLEIPFSNIQKNRELMGVSYLAKPNDFYETLFGETSKPEFQKFGNDIVYTGSNSFFNKFETEEEQTQNLTPKSEPEPIFSEELFEEKPLFNNTVANTKQTKPDITDEKANILVNNNEIISDDDLFETEPIKLPSEPEQTKNVIEENLITPETEKENASTLTPNIENENPKETNPQDYLDLRQDIITAITPRSFENYLNLTEEIDKAERGHSFEDYLNLDEKIRKEEQGKSFNDYLIIKDNEESMQPKAVAKNEKQEKVASSLSAEENVLGKYSRIIHRDQRTLADFANLAKEKQKVVKNQTKLNQFEEDNIILPTAEKSTPNIIYLQPLSLGKINEPLPKKAIIKSSEITYKQAEKAIDEIVNSMLGNILKENKITNNAVKFEEKIENQISKLTVKQMQELIVEIEKFKVQTLTSIFESKSAIRKEECGVKSASALINKEPKERHTLLKTDIKKIVLTYLKNAQGQEQKMQKPTAENVVLKPSDKPKKPFTMADNLECYVETKVFEKEKIEIKQTETTKTETVEQKITRKKKLNAKQTKDESLIKPLNPIKQKPIKVVRQIRCTNCPLGVKINVKIAKAKSSSKNLE